MGRATITGGGGEGLYQIEVDLGEDLKTAAVAELTATIAQATARQAAADARLVTAINADAAAQSALDVATNLYAAAAAAGNGDSQMDAWKRANVAAIAAKQARQAAQLDVTQWRLEVASLERELALMQAAEVSLSQAAYCLDYTEDGAGEVSTVEIPGESDLILIQAGATSPTAEDGQLIAREVQSAAQVFFNAAVLPGWQKWKPTYRTGTITAISYSGDTADVSLDPATSSAQSLGVNLLDALSAVPIEYMTCNAEAFEVGNRCVVRLVGRSWENPKIVGFAEGPMKCPIFPDEVFLDVQGESIQQTGGSPGTRRWSTHPTITVSLVPCPGDTTIWHHSAAQGDFPVSPPSETRLRINSLDALDSEILEQDPTVEYEGTLEEVVYAHENDWSGTDGGTYVPPGVVNYINTLGFDDGEPYFAILRSRIDTVTYDAPPPNGYTWNEDIECYVIEPSVEFDTYLPGGASSSYVYQGTLHEWLDNEGHLAQLRVTIRGVTKTYTATDARAYDVNFTTNIVKAKVVFTRDPE